ncbi:MAG: LysM peptidoglycan-binding domain-containing protein [Treponema sp.]|jgi:LysM repeat protein|nr:LysM peptidoglycan-binding domain-containing protein [Treponema sp.]
MNRKISFILSIIVIIAVQSLYAGDNLPEPELKLPQFYFVPYYAGAAEDDSSMSIRNNEFYLESLRLAKLAQETYEYGDYDASAGFAEEAIRYAQLSDEYVASQLISTAKQHLDMADSNNIASKYPNDYDEGKAYYETSIAAYYDEDWNAAITAATKSIEILAYIESGAPPRQAGDALPSQYTVRPWALTKDCLWNIAGYPWVYGDAWKWKTLYEANKSKMPQPDNPDLIEPGMVLDIPSIKGEARQGMWDPNRTYKAP